MIYTREEDFYLYEQFSKGARPSALGALYKVKMLMDEEEK
jgi:hypothetical protein